MNFNWMIFLINNDIYVYIVILNNLIKYKFQEPIEPQIKWCVFATIQVSFSDQGSENVEEMLKEKVGRSPADPTWIPWNPRSDR